LSKTGGQYNEGGEYEKDKANGENVVFKNGPKGALVIEEFKVFNHSTRKQIGGKWHGAESLASYGTVTGPNPNPNPALTTTLSLNLTLTLR